MAQKHEKKKRKNFLVKHDKFYIFDFLKYFTSKKDYFKT